MNRNRMINLVLISFTMMSCSFMGSVNQSTATSATAEVLPTNIVPADGGWTGEAIIIDDVKLHYDNPDLYSAKIEISGFYPDGCTELSEILTTREGSIFTIRLMTMRPMDAHCTMALVPFNTEVSLDFNDMADGEIVEVDIYGSKTKFVVGQIQQANKEKG